MTNSSCTRLSNSNLVFKHKLIWKKNRQIINQNHFLIRSMLTCNYWTVVYRQDFCFSYEKHFVSKKHVESKSMSLNYPKKKKKKLNDEYRAREVY